MRFRGYWSRRACCFWHLKPSTIPVRRSIGQIVVRTGSLDPFVARAVEVEEKIIADPGNGSTWNRSRCNAPVGFDEIVGEFRRAIVALDNGYCGGRYIPPRTRLLQGEPVAGRCPHRRVFAIRGVAGT